MISSVTFHEIVQCFWNETCPSVKVYEVFYQPINSFLGFKHPFDPKCSGVIFRVAVVLNIFTAEGELIKYVASCFKISGSDFISILDNEDEINSEFGVNVFAGLIQSQVPFRIIKGWWNQKHTLIELTYTHHWESWYKGNNFLIEDGYKDLITKSYTLALEDEIGTDIDSMILADMQLIKSKPYELLHLLEQIDNLANYS